MSKENRYLAFVDLLGFREMVESNFDNAKTVLSDFYNICYKSISTNKQIQGDLISDSLFLYTLHNGRLETLTKVLISIYQQCLLNNRYFNEGQLLAPRGIITYGRVHTQIRNKADNLGKGFIVSDALVRAVKYENMFNGSRLILLLKNTQLGNIKKDFKKNMVKAKPKPEISVENNNHKAYDILWFNSIVLKERLI